MYPSPDTPFRDLGLAEHKYLAEGELEYRLEVARMIRLQAGNLAPDLASRDKEKFYRYRRMLRKQADRLENCRLQYAKVGCTQCLRLYIGPRRCEVRICEHCAKKFAAKLRKRQVDLSKLLPPTADGRRAMFLTVTLFRHPNHAPTQRDIDRIFTAFKRLMHALWPTNKGCGALAVLEIGEKFNLHIHALVYGHYVNRYKLSRLWHECTGDSKVVHIKQVTKLKGCISYLLKYITKPDPRKDPERAAKWLALLIGQRRVRTYGVFYGKVKLFAPVRGCPCPYCQGKLCWNGYDDGRCLPKEALLWEEAFALTALTKN